MSLDILDAVRVCLAGPSWWADYWHLPAIQNHPNAEIVGVCGEKARDAAAVRAKYGDSARYFTDIDAMLDATEPDGLIVCTPNDLHYPATMAALTRSISVVCEKPISMNENQAREMAETAQNSGLPGMSNFTYRGNPALQQMQKMVSEGFVGTPLHITGAYLGGYALGRPPGWRGNRDRSGSGILGDLGSHLIDMARFVTGQEFAAVCAHNLTALWNENPDLPPRLVRTEAPEVAPRNDDSCAFLAEFQSGMQGIFHTSWIATMARRISGKNWNFTAQKADSDFTLLSWAQRWNLLKSARRIGRPFRFRASRARTKAKARTKISFGPVAWTQPTMSTAGWTQSRPANAKLRPRSRTDGARSRSLTPC